MQITHFIGLRPKRYTLKVKQNEEALKNVPKKFLPFKGKEEEQKGVKKSVIKKSLSFADKIRREMNIIRSENHDIYSMTVNKVALSANDDTRLICLNKINTLALRPITNK